MKKYKHSRHLFVTVKHLSVYTMFWLYIILIQPSIPININISKHIPKTNKYTFNTCLEVYMFIYYIYYIYIAILDR